MTIKVDDEQLAWRLSNELPGAKIIYNAKIIIDGRWAKEQILPTTDIYIKSDDDHFFIESPSIETTIFVIKQLAPLYLQEFISDSSDTFPFKSC